MTKSSQNLVRVDPKGRIVLPQSARGVAFYSVEETGGGEIILHPRVVADPREVISKRTLAVLDEAMDNFEKGKTGKPIDLNPFIEKSTKSKSSSNGKKQKVKNK